MSRDNGMSTPNLTLDNLLSIATICAMVKNRIVLLDLLKGEMGPRIREILDPGQISRITRGIRAPSLHTAIDLSKTTDGALPVEGWQDVEPSSTLEEDQAEDRAWEAGPCMCGRQDSGAVFDERRVRVEE